MITQSPTIGVEDALRTIAVNGAYNASRALSKWLRRGVRLTCEGFQQIPISDVSKTIGAEDEAVAAIHLPLSGDLGGHLLLAFPDHVALALADIMLCQESGTATVFEELEESALCETGNIVGSAYANCLAKWLKLHVAPGVPTFAHDMVCSIVDPLLMEYAAHSDEILVATSEFLLDGQQLQWSMLLLPSQSSFQLMQERCGLDTVRRNALQTIAVNGAFNASRAMSKWLKRGVKIATEGFSQVSLGGVSTMLDESQPVVGLLMKLTDQMHGHSLLTIPYASALRLVELLMGQSPGSVTEIGELEQSCLEETGNIISGAFVNSWATWLDARIEPAVPQFVIDLPSAIIESTIAEQALVSDELFMARTDFKIDDRAVEWMFILLPSPSAMRLIEMATE